MPILFSAMKFLITIGFLVLLITVGVYIVVPLMLLLPVFYALWCLKEKWEMYRQTREANGCTMRPAKPRQNPQIIDVEYTEIE